MENLKPKVIAFSFTISIIVLLLIAGPVQALIMGLSVSDTSIMIGQSVIFTAGVEIEAEEEIQINALSLDLSGPISSSCLFTINGTKISSCNGIEIELIENSTGNNNYGYGYGIPGSILKYNITLDSTNYPAGTYSTKIIAITNQGIKDTGGPDIIIFTEGATLEKCSVRADDGSMILLEEEFGENNKINFNIPMARAVNGKGTLTAQFNNKRFSYSFEIKEILSNNDESASIFIDGEYKIQRGERIREQATITLNKQNNTVDVTSSDFKVRYMNVNFIKGC